MTVALLNEELRGLFQLLSCDEVATDKGPVLSYPGNYSIASFRGSDGITCLDEVSTKVGELEGIDNLLSMRGSFCISRPGGPRHLFVSLRRKLQPSHISIL